MIILSLSLTHTHAHTHTHSPSLSRWASAGLEFLKLVCAPRLLATITQTQFEELKKLINRCLDHMTETHPLHVEASMYNSTAVYN